MENSPKTEEDCDLIPFKWCLLNIDDTLTSGTTDSYQGLVATAACCKHHKTKHKTNDGLFVCLFQDNLCKGHTRIIYASEKEWGWGDKSYFTAQISQLLV